MLMEFKLESHKDKKSSISYFYKILYWMYLDLVKSNLHSITNLIT